MRLWLAGTILSIAGLAGTAGPAVCAAAPPQAAPLPPGGAVVGTNLSIGTLNTGTVLQVQATVAPGGRYVGINFNGSNSTLNGLDSISVASGPFRPAQLGHVVFVHRHNALLMAEVPAERFRHATLAQMLNKLASSSKTNLAAAWLALRQAGIPAGRRFSLVLQRQPMKFALARILKTVAPHVPLVVTAGGDMLWVTTRQQDDQHMVTRRYSMAELLENLPRYVSPKTNLRTVAAPRPTERRRRPADPYRKAEDRFLRGGHAEEYSDYRPAARKVARRERVPAQTNITALICSTVRPHIWARNGGRATISIYRDRVFITAPRNVQALLSGPARRRGARQ